MIKIKVNGKIVKTDGDWFECPECDYFDCILLKWMNYCPNCATSLNIEECNNDIKNAPNQSQETKQGLTLASDGKEQRTHGNMTNVTSPLMPDNNVEDEIKKELLKDLEEFNRKW